MDGIGDREGRWAAETVAKGTYLLLGIRIHVSAVGSVLWLELIHLLPSAALVHRRLVRLHALVLLLKLLVGSGVVLLELLL